MKQFSCQEKSHKSVSGHHSVQQPLIPQCFSGKKFVAEAKPQAQLCLITPRKHSLSNFIEEREACKLKKVQSNIYFSKQALNPK